MEVMDTLAPVFVLVSVGFLLSRSGFADEHFFRTATQFTYWIGLPALLLKSIAEASLTLSDTWRIFLVMIAASLLIALLSAFLSQFLPLAPNRRRTFIHTSFHCNTAVVGLPVIFYALAAHPQGARFIDMASVTLAPTVPIITVLSLIVMHGGVHIHGRRLGWTIARMVAVNPLVLACLAGLLWSFCDLPIPVILSRSLGSLAGVALPLGLFSIGAQLNQSDIGDSLPLALLAAGLNVIALPLVGWILCRFLGLTPAETVIALIFLACPASTSTFVYARQMHGDPTFASTVILISTLISAPILWLILFYGR